MKKIAVTIALFVFVFVITDAAVVYQAQREYDLHFFTAYQQTSLHLFRTVFFGLAMFFGIVLGHLHSRLSLRPANQKVRIGHELKSALSQGNFWRALVSSPIIFGVVYGVTKDQPDLVVAGLLAFENGFFCHVIFKQKSHQVLPQEKKR